MTNLFVIQRKTLTDIANAIRAKTGGSASMAPADMVTAIGSIGGGGGVTDRLKTAEVTLTQDYATATATPAAIMALCASAVGTANYVVMLKSFTKTGDDLKALFYGGVHIEHLGDTLPLTLNYESVARINSDTGRTLQTVGGLSYNSKAWSGDVYQVWGWD